MIAVINTNSLWQFILVFARATVSLIIDLHHHLLVNDLEGA